MGLWKFRVSRSVAVLAQGFVFWPLWISLALRQASIMAPPTYPVAERTDLIAILKPNLAFVLAKAEVDMNFQAHMAKCGVTSLARFAMLGDDQATVETTLKDDLSLDKSENLAMKMMAADVVSAWSVARIKHQKAAELEADAQLAEQSITVPLSDHKLMRKAWEKINGEMPLAETPGRYFLGTKIDQAAEDEPIVEKLTEVSSKKENESEIWTPCYDASGRIQSKKGAPVKVKRPSDSEELRRSHRLIGNAWMMVHLQHSNRPWLEGLCLKDWSDFTDYVVGEKCAKYYINFESGRNTSYPSWHVVLNYEHELRRKAYEMVTKGVTLKQALKDVIEHDGTRGTHFSTPYQIEVGLAGAGAGKGGKGSAGGHFGVTAIKDAFGKGSGAASSALEVWKPQKQPKGGKPTKGKGKKGKDGKQKKHFKLNGRNICFAYNKGEKCDGQCGMVHVCQLCLLEHPMIKHDEQ